MDQKTKDAIRQKAEDNGWDLDAAIYAHIVQNDAVIIRSGGQVPAGADYEAIAEIREQLESSDADPASADQQEGTTPLDGLVARLSRV